MATYVQYGPYRLNLINIEDYSRQAVYMGKNFAFSKVRLKVRCWLNPFTQNDQPGPPQAPFVGDDGKASYYSLDTSIPSEPGGPLAGNPIAEGETPTLTETALRNNLMVPRQQLVFVFNDDVSLTSPPDGYDTDATGGPIPVACSVVRISPRTWQIVWEVETDVRETIKGANPPILAMQYSMTESLNEDFFATRIIQGSVLFHVGELNRLGRNPDDYRSQLFVPPPGNFKRARVDVKSDSENPGLIHFSVVDRQLPAGWSEPTITRLRASHSIRTTKPGWESQDVLPHLTQAASHGGDAVEHAAKSITAQGLAGTAFAIGAASGEVTPVAWIANLVGAVAQTMAIYQGYEAVHSGASAAGEGAAAAYGSLPVSSHRIIVEVWGTPDSQRSVLEAFARSVIQARLTLFSVTVRTQTTPPRDTADPYVDGLMSHMSDKNTSYLSRAADSIALANAPSMNQPLPTAAPPAVTAALVPFGVDTEVFHDIAGRFVRMSYTGITGPIGSLLEGAGGSVNLTKSLMPLSNDTLNGQTPVLSSTLPPGTPPINSNYTRGSFLEDVISAALTSPQGLVVKFPSGTLSDTTKDSTKSPTQP